MLLNFANPKIFKHFTFKDISLFKTININVMGLILQKLYKFILNGITVYFSIFIQINNFSSKANHFTNILHLKFDGYYSYYTQYTVPRFIQ